MSGVHNWGYDGVLWHAVHEPYGGPAGYQRFVDGCHQAGLGVIQDVVYNHLGPSGNYLPEFGPYLKTGRNTWGDLVNLDGEGSAEVRRFILDNVRMWLDDYHVDGLRLDAVHALADSSDVHLLEEMAIEVAALSAHQRRPLTLIAESDLNDAEAGHSARGRRLRARRAVERRLPPRGARRADRRDARGGYADFEPLSALAKVCERGFFHDGTWSSYRGRDHGVPIDTAAMPTLAAGGVRAEPRPGRQPRRRRPHRRHARRRPAGVRRAADAGGAVHADAVPGRGVGGVDAVPVLHLPRGARAGRGDGEGPDRGVRAARLGPRRRARPAGPRDVHAVQARLVRARRGPARPDARGLPAAGRAAPRAARADRPVVRAGSAARPTRRPGCSPCAAATSSSSSTSAPSR